MSLPPFKVIIISLFLSLSLSLTHTHTLSLSLSIYFFCSLSFSPSSYLSGSPCPPPPPLSLISSLPLLFSIFLLSLILSPLSFLLLSLFPSINLSIILSFLPLSSLFSLFPLPSPSLVYGLGGGSDFKASTPWHINHEASSANSCRTHVWNAFLAAWTALSTLSAGVLGTLQYTSPVDGS